MEQVMHFNASLGTCQAILNDGTKAVVLSFTDKEKGIVHHYPIPVDIADDIGHEMIRLSNV